MNKVFIVIWVIIVVIFVFLLLFPFIAFAINRWNEDEDRRRYEESERIKNAKKNNR